MKKSLYVLFAFFILVSIKTASLAEITPYGDEISVGRDTSSGDPHTAMAEDGSFLVVWVQVDQKNPWGVIERSRILAKLYNPDGTEKSGEFDISVKSGNNRAHSVAMAPDGSFTVTWARGNTTYYNFFARRFYADGIPKDSTEIQVTNNPYIERGGASVGVAGDGSFVVVIKSRYRFQFKIYNSDGTVRRGLSTIGSAYGAKVPSLEVAPEGSFLVTWSQWGGLISAKKFSPSGEQLGSKITFNTDIYSYPLTRAVIAPDGGFMITWADDDVYAKRYNAQGTPIGTVFRVNTQTKLRQWDQHITMANDGSFLIIWKDNYYKAIYGQQYSSEGVPYGSPSFIMPKYGFNLSKRIAADGSFVIAISRYSAPELRAQLFRLDCQNPVADAGMDGAYEQTNPEGAYVDLDGLASTGKDISYDWSWDGGTVSGPEQTVMLPPGDNIVTLTVTNGNCSAYDSDTVLKTVQDTIAPSTDTVSIKGDKGNEDWYLTDVNITMIASDSGSGVRKVYYQINGGAILSVSGDTAMATFTTEGVHTVKYWAVDNSGNVETARELILKIDKSAPITTVVAPIAKAYTVAKDLTIEFTVNDAISGLESINASLDGQVVANGQIIDLLGLYVTNGKNHAFTVSATDVAGNLTEKTVLFKSIVTGGAIIDIINAYLASGDIKNKGIATSLIKQISNGGINDFLNHVTAQEGKGISLDAATILIKLAGSL